MTIETRNKLAGLLIEYNMELKEREAQATKNALMGSKEALKEMDNVMDTIGHIQALLVALDKEC